MSSTQMVSVISGRTIPKALAGLAGMESGFQVATPNQSRLLLSGSPGAGKSTFLNSNPKLLMIDEERGGRTVADPQALRFTVPDSVPSAERDMAYLEFVDKIIAAKRAGTLDVEMVGFDSYNEIIETFSRALCLRSNVTDVGDVGGGHGRGYAMVRTSITDMLDRVYKAGMGWAMIGHSAMDQATQTSYLDVSPSFQGAIFRKCEHYLWIQAGTEYVKQPPLRQKVKGQVIEKPQPDLAIPGRFILTGEGGLWRGGKVSDLKSRLPLPDQFRIPAMGGWAEFERVYNEAASTLVGGSPS